MTQVQFTLTEQEILQVLSGDGEETFKMLVKKILDQIMLAEFAKELCGKSFSKSTVSQLCKKLDAEIEAFRNRPLGNLIERFNRELKRSQGTAIKIRKKPKKHLYFSQFCKTRNYEEYRCIFFAHFIHRSSDAFLPRHML